MIDLRTCNFAHAITPLCAHCMHTRHHAHNLLSPVLKYIITSNIVLHHKHHKVYYLVDGTKVRLKGKVWQELPGWLFHCKLEWLPILTTSFYIYINAWWCYGKFQLFKGAIVTMKQLFPVFSICIYIQIQK